MDYATLVQQKYARLSQNFKERYEPSVRRHLSQVYLVLGGTTAITAIGALLHMRRLIDLGLLAPLASLLLVLGLHFYRDNQKNYYQRLSMLLAFGFCSGQSLGPMLSYVAIVNPATIFTALIGTTVTFGTLSVAAMLAERGKYLYLGGILASVINTMLMISLLNIFFQVYFVQMFQLYIGVFIMAGFMVYDTQNIIERCRMGNRDVVQHAMDLFFDVLSMFRRLLVILNHKEERKQREEQRRKNN